MGNQKREPVKPVNEWTCLVCKGEPKFTHKAMMTHIQTVHQIDIKNEKASRTMIEHMDAEDWFSSTYEWELKGLKFSQHTVELRDKSDPMSMMHC